MVRYRSPTAATGYTDPVSRSDDERTAGILSTQPWTDELPDPAEDQRPSGRHARQPGFEADEPTAQAPSWQAPATDETTIQAAAWQPPAAASDQPASTAPLWRPPAYTPQQPPAYRPSPIRSTSSHRRNLHDRHTPATAVPPGPRRTDQEPLQPQRLGGSPFAAAMTATGSSSAVYWFLAPTLRLPTLGPYQRRRRRRRPAWRLAAR